MKLAMQWVPSWKSVLGSFEGALSSLSLSLSCCFLLALLNGPELEYKLFYSLMTSIVLVRCLSKPSRQESKPITELLFYHPLAFHFAYHHTIAVV